jgi:hypothetical protein
MAALVVLAYLNYRDHRPIDWRSGHPRGWPVAFFYSWPVDVVEFRASNAAVDGVVAILIALVAVAVDRRLRRAPAIFRLACDIPPPATQR